MMMTTKAQLRATLRKLRAAILDPDPVLDKRLEELGFPHDAKADLELLGMIKRLEEENKGNGMVGD